MSRRPPCAMQSTTRKMSTVLPVGGDGIPESRESPPRTSSYSLPSSEPGGLGTLGVGVAEESGRLGPSAVVCRVEGRLSPAPSPPGVAPTVAAAAAPERIASNAASHSALRPLTASCSRSPCARDCASPCAAIAWIALSTEKAAPSTTELRRGYIALASVAAASAARRASPTCACTTAIASLCCCCMALICCCCCCRCCCICCCTVAMSAAKCCPCVRPASSCARMDSSCARKAAMICPTYSGGTASPRAGTGPPGVR